MCFKWQQFRAALWFERKSTKTIKRNCSNWECSHKAQWPECAIFNGSPNKNRIAKISPNRHSWLKAIEHLYSPHFECGENTKREMIQFSLFMYNVQCLNVQVYTSTCHILDQIIYLHDRCCDCHSFATYHIGMYFWAETCNWYNSNKMCLHLFISESHSIFAPKWKLIQDRRCRRCRCHCRCRHLSRRRQQQT